MTGTSTSSKGTRKTAQDKKRVQATKRRKNLQKELLSSILSNQSALSGSPIQTRTKNLNNDVGFVSFLDESQRTGLSPSEAVNILIDEFGTGTPNDSGSYINNVDHKTETADGIVNVSKLIDGFGHTVGSDTKDTKELIEEFNPENKINVVDDYSPTTKLIDSFGDDPDHAGTTRFEHATGSIKTIIDSFGDTQQKLPDNIDEIDITLNSLLQSKSSTTPKNKTIPQKNKSQAISQPEIALQTKPPPSIKMQFDVGMQQFAVDDLNSRVQSAADALYLSPEEQKTMIERMKTIVVSSGDWIRRNYKYMLYAAALSAAIPIVVSAASSFAFGNFSYLSAFSAFSKICPSWVVTTASTLGKRMLNNAVLSSLVGKTVGAIMKIAKTNVAIKNALERERIPPKFMKTILGKFGIQLTPDGKPTVTIGNIATRVATFSLITALSYSVVVDPTSLQNFDFTSAVTFTPLTMDALYGTASVYAATGIINTIRGKSANETTVPVSDIMNDVDTVKRHTANVLLNDLSAQTSSITNIPIERLSNTAQQIQTETNESSIASQKRTLIQKIQTNTVFKQITNHRKAVYAIGGCMLAVATAVYAPDNILKTVSDMFSNQIERLGPMFQNFVKTNKDWLSPVMDIVGNTHVSYIVVTVLTDICGINGLINSMYGYITPAQTNELKTINELLKTERDQTKIGVLSDRFMSVLHRRSYHTVEQLSAMELESIKTICSERGIETVGQTKTQMIIAIRSAQSATMSKIGGLISFALNAVTQCALSSFIQANLKSGVELVKDTIAQENSLQQLHDELTRDKAIRDEKIASERAVRRKELVKLSKAKKELYDARKEAERETIQSNRVAAKERLELRQSVKQPQQQTSVVYTGVTETGEPISQISDTNLFLSESIQIENAIQSTTPDIRISKSGIFDPELYTGKNILADVLSSTSITSHPELLNDLASVIPEHVLKVLDEAGSFQPFANKVLPAVFKSAVDLAVAFVPGLGTYELAAEFVQTTNDVIDTAVITTSLYEIVGGLLSTDTSKIEAGIAHMTKQLTTEKFEIPRVGMAAEYISEKYLKNAIADVKYKDLVLDLLTRGMGENWSNSKIMLELTKSLTFGI